MNEYFSSLTGAAPYLICLIVAAGLCVRRNAQSPFAYTLAGTALVVALFNTIALGWWIENEFSQWEETLPSFALTVLVSAPLLLLILAVMDASPDAPLGAGEVEEKPTPRTALLRSYWAWGALAAIVYATALSLASRIDDTTVPAIVGVGPYLLALSLGAGFFVRHKDWYLYAWRPTVSALGLAAICCFVQLWLQEGIREQELLHRYGESGALAQLILSGFLRSLCDAVPIGLLFWTFLRCEQKGDHRVHSSTDSRSRDASVSERRLQEVDMVDRIAPRAVGVIGWGSFGLLAGAVVAFILTLICTRLAYGPPPTGGGGMGGTMYGMAVGVVLFYYFLPPCTILGVIAGVMYAVKRWRR